MNHKRAIFLSFAAALSVVTVFVLGSVSATSISSPRVRDARANEADIQRWVAMGEYYSKQPASVVDSGLQLSRDTAAGRWQAMGEYYSKRSASAAVAGAQLSRDADAARWQALGEAYLGINLRARQADAARWQALGEYYTQAP